MNFQFSILDLQFANNHRAMLDWRFAFQSQTANRKSQIADGGAA